MRIANVNGRLHLVDRKGRGADVQKISGGEFSPLVSEVYGRWDEFTTWAASADLSDAILLDQAELGPPSPAPRQIFAIGLNYDEHANEAGFTAPAAPTVFTKFASSLTGPVADVVLPAGGHVDWEVELVAVVGRTATRVDAADAWTHVAGLTLGQDLSERLVQLDGPVPQFSLGKSYPNFGPIGPWLVTPDEFPDPDDLELGCTLNGVEVQRGQTRELIHSVPRLVAYLSSIVTLYPGDLVFTGTPAGVGMGRSPQRWLSPGDELVSWCTGLGSLRQRMLAH